MIRSSVAEDGIIVVEGTCVVEVSQDHFSTSDYWPAKFELYIDPFHQPELRSIQVEDSTI